nr:stage V sporulation protein AD [bacterium]
MDKRLGSQSIVFEKPPVVAGYASIVGPKEGQGPLAGWFDEIIDDDTMGEDSYEKAERVLYRQATQMAMKKANISDDMMDLMIGGDLLNQIVTASFAARDLGIPFLGLYGACSTMAESLLLGSVMIDGGFAARIACATASHFSTAERQYRVPLEMGSQRAPTAQRTVTGAGAVVLARDGNGARLTGGTIGRVIDYGIMDVNNMGAAMAPAVAETISMHLIDNGFAPEHYDRIVTGDLGHIGKRLVLELLQERGFDLSERLFDCGCEIFSSGQNVDAGGSGAGCCASVLGGYLLRNLGGQGMHRMLFVASGALLSVTSSQQGESIPAIAHAVAFEAD